MLKIHKLFWGILLFICSAFSPAGFELQAEAAAGTAVAAETEAAFPQELGTALEETFMEGGWRGIQELIANGEHSGADGSQPEKEGQQLYAGGSPDCCPQSRNRTFKKELIHSD